MILDIHLDSNFNYLVIGPSCCNRFSFSDKTTFFGVLCDLSDSIAEPKVSKSWAIAVLFRTPGHAAEISTECSRAFGIPGMQIENRAMTHPSTPSE